MQTNSGEFKPSFSRKQESLNSVIFKTSIFSFSFSFSASNSASFCFSFSANNSASFCLSFSAINSASFCCSFNGNCSASFCLSFSANNSASFSASSLASLCFPFSASFLASSSFSAFFFSSSFSFAPNASPSFWASFCNLPDFSLSSSRSTSFEDNFCCCWSFVLSLLFNLSFWMLSLSSFWFVGRLLGLAALLELEGLSWDLFCSFLEFLFGLFESFLIVVWVFSVGLLSISKITLRSLFCWLFSFGKDWFDFFWASWLAFLLFESNKILLDSRSGISWLFGILLTGLPWSDLLLCGLLDFLALKSDTELLLGWFKDITGSELRVIDDRRLALWLFSFNGIVRLYLAFGEKCRGFGETKERSGPS